MSVERSQAETAYLDAFAAAGDALPRAEWFEPARQAARERFAETGLPHRRNEAWRWTDLRTMLDRDFPPALGVAAPAPTSAEVVSAFAALERHVVTFVDGRLSEAQSDLSGLAKVIDVVSFADGLAQSPDWVKRHLGRPFAEEGDALTALNTMFLTGGLAIRVPDGSAVDRPVELVFVNTGAEPCTLNTRCLVVAGEGSALTVLESHLGAGEGRYVANSWCEFVLEKGAKVHHVKTQNEGAGAVHLANTDAEIGAEATFATVCLSTGARTARNQIKVRLAGEGGHVGITGAYLLTGRQHCDTALMVDHAMPGCTSNELFKCVMDDHARGIFQGKIIVRPGAQKTDGMQMSQGLLLSETAEFDAKPELEIFADDVRCTHGATSGELDEDLLFYLRSRGIPADQAKSLLISAFIGEALEEIEAEDIRDAASEYVARLRAEKGETS